MKICVVTMNSSYNYGAMLQAYALQTVLLSQGHDCRFIDQRKSFEREISFCKSPSKLVHNLFSLIYKKSLLQGYRSFERFIADHEKLTENFANYETLQQNPPDADVFITGSDQVFNPVSFRPINFLDFVPSDKKRISYAASLGVSTIPQEKRQKFSEYLNKMDSISVRESDAKKLLCELTDKEISVHIDPVFLLPKEEWRKLAKPVSGIKKPYILCYILYNPPWLNKELKKLRKRTGMDIVVVANEGFRNIYHNKMIRSAGPQEFLWLFDNAERIVTTSFHGTAFSLVFEKPFWAAVNPHSPSRISDLLSLFGAKQAVVQDFETEPAKVDCAFVKKVQQEQREQALDYLKKAIRGV